ncbi:MAG: PD-(D/E)XK nuclease family protein [Bdellovibrionota bacterium]
MSKYYKSKRSRNLYDPDAEKPFRLSRSKIDAFLNCPRCFYIDRRLGTGQPPGYPFNLNSAVDELLKNEFDQYRTKRVPHPLMTEHNLDAIPFEHEKMDEWRDSLRRGIQLHHERTNLLITGGVDDVWVRPNGELIIVDYKATSKNSEVSLDADWQIGYKRQMEIYQWLFRQNGFQVSDTGYFVYCNGDASKPSFDGVLHFDISLLPYEGNDDWVEQAILDAHACLNQDTIPDFSEDCDFANTHKPFWHFKRYNLLLAFLR